MQKQYLAPTDLVDRYKGKITVRTLANWRSQGIRPPFTKIGGRILYHLADLALNDKFVDVPERVGKFGAVLGSGVYEVV
jgi:hypothetical protein